MFLVIGDLFALAFREKRRESFSLGKGKRGQNLTIATNFAFLDDIMRAFSF